MAVRLLRDMFFLSRTHSCTHPRTASDSRINVAQRHNAMAETPSDRECHFLTLPAEVRHQVYRHLFTDALIALDKDKRDVICSEKRRCHTAIFQTCHRLQDEAQPIFVQSMTLRIDSYKIRDIHLPPILRHDGRQHLRVLAFSLTRKYSRPPVLDPSYFPNLQHLRLLQHPRATSEVMRLFPTANISDARQWLADQAEDTSLIEQFLSSYRTRAIIPGGFYYIGTKPNWMMQVYHNRERQYRMTVEMMVRLTVGADIHPSNDLRWCCRYCFVYELDLNTKTQHLRYITDLKTGTKLDLSQCLAFCHGGYDRFSRYEASA